MNTPVFPFAKSQPVATDAELVELLHACARRSLPALRQLYDRTAPRLLGTLLQMFGDLATAEAALADCYEQIWLGAGNYSRERCPPLVWLQSIARQLAIDSLRDQPAATPPDEVDAGLLLQDAALAEEFPLPEQRILRLAWSSGRSPAEIARALEWPVQQVRRTIRSSLLAMLGSPSS